MKKNSFFCLILFFSVLQLKAQKQIEEGPLSEPRFTFFRRGIVAFNEYLNTENGSFNTTNLRILQPFGSKAFNLRIDVPIISTKNAASLNQTGLGDINFAIAYIPKMNEKTGIVFRGKLGLPTASEMPFGSGKWIFTPSFFVGNYWDMKKKWLSITTLEHQFSVIGQANRNNINVSIFENTFLYYFSKNWIGLNAAIRYNFEKDGFQNSSFFELGRKVNSNFLVYLHPSFGYGKAKSYNTGMELGLQILY